MTLSTISARNPSRPELQPASRAHSRRGLHPRRSSWPISSRDCLLNLESVYENYSNRRAATRRGSIEVDLRLHADTARHGHADGSRFPTATSTAASSRRSSSQGPRSCQYRLRRLVDHGLVRTWRVVMRPGRVCRSSIYLLSRRGAAALAEWLDEEPRQYLRRADHALERRFHLVHQLEANQFFVELAFAARDLPGHGLYHWVGEHGVQDAYAEGDERGPIPDGWGRLLTPDREVLIHLEWDRGTEQPRRLRAKLHPYTAYFAERAGACHNQVLFVAPTEQRSARLPACCRTMPTQNAKAADLDDHDRTVTCHRTAPERSGAALARGGGSRC